MKYKIPCSHCGEEVERENPVSCFPCKKKRIASYRADKKNTPQSWDKETKRFKTH